MPDTTFITGVEAVTWIAFSECYTADALTRAVWSDGHSWRGETPADVIELLEARPEPLSESEQRRLNDARAARSAADAWVERYKEAEAILFEACLSGRVVLEGIEVINAVHSDKATNQTVPIPTSHFPKDSGGVRLTINPYDNVLSADGARPVGDWLHWRDPVYSRITVRTAHIRELPTLNTHPNGAPTIRDERACGTWLVEQMRQSERPSGNKEDYKAEAQSRFHISGRGFDRMWAEAIVETGAAGWRKPGAKPMRRD